MWCTRPAGAFWRYLRITVLLRPTSAILYTYSRSCPWSGVQVLRMFLILKMFLLSTSLWFNVVFPASAGSLGHVNT